MPQELKGGIQLTYSASDFHPLCGDVHLVEVGGVGYLFCPKCRSMGHVDLVMHRVSVETCRAEVKLGESYS